MVKILPKIFESSYPKTVLHVSIMDACENI